MVEYYRKNEIIAEAVFIIENKATLREAEQHFNVSRSTISRDIAIRLPKIDRDLAQKANAVLQANKAENRSNIKVIRKAFLEGNA